METYEKTYPFPQDKRQTRKCQIPHKDKVISFGIVLLLILILAIAIPVSRIRVSKQEVSTLLTSFPIIDGHNEVLLQIYEKSKNKLERVDLSRRLENDPAMLNFQTDIVRMREGGLGGQFWTIAVSCNISQNPVRIALDQLDTLKRILKQNKDLTFVQSSEEMKKTLRRNELVNLAGLSGGAAIANSLRVFRLYYELGVRYFSFAYDKCRPSWADESLTAFGQAIVKEANRLGMILDLSDLNKIVSLEILNVTLAPVIYSHTAAYKLCDHYENIDDDILLKLKQNKGIAMVTFASIQVNCNTSREASEWDVADHLQHIKDVCGEDCIGIGANFDSGRKFPERLHDVGMYKTLLKVLNSRGWTNKDITKLSQENLIRVMDDVEAVAKGMLQKGEEPAEDQFI